ncbi:DUF6584 family protein [Streptomyces sp. NBC_01224]|uniref:DUF6584 family protein n=1 Tax=Streptomyces sp. NBC_01224 TaxID=2903783 RepID=UPI002E126B9E
MKSGAGVVERPGGAVRPGPLHLGLPHRQRPVVAGPLGEAGRWGTCLEEDRLPDEVAAFEERYSDPARWMRALAWQGQESAADSPFVEQQLAAVRAAASKALGHPVTWDTLAEARGDAPEAGSFGQSLAAVGCALLAIVSVGIRVNGFLDLFR